jgi:hypothetical protein
MKTSKLAFITLFSAILILGFTLTTSSAEAGSKWNLSIGHGHGHSGHGFRGHRGFGHFHGGHIDYIPVRHGCHYDYVPVWHGYY